MRKMNLARSLVAAIAVIVTLWACKHEILYPNPTDGGGTGGGTTGGTQPCSPDSVYFQQQILPLIVSNCAKSGCHDAASHVEGLNLTTYTGIMKIVKPNNPGGSKLLSVIVTNNLGDRMPPPPDPKMPQDQINLITKWIQQGAKNNSCSSACDSSLFTFSGAIKPLITAQCQGCHTGSAAGGGIDLSTYNGVKAAADNGKLWGSIHKDPGFAPMPPAGTGLSDCQLTQFKKWIDAGAPNN
ncbi:MAG: hypothetical protein JNN29_11580 [Chitinophagaceae bacterium]|nr:hypothetical protein [Chitinophagaceae bacterium]